MPSQYLTSPANTHNYQIVLNSSIQHPNSSLQFPTFISYCYKIFIYLFHLSPFNFTFYTFKCLDPCFRSGWPWVIHNHQHRVQISSSSVIIWSWTDILIEVTAFLNFQLIYGLHQSRLDHPWMIEQILSSSIMFQYF